MIDHDLVEGRIKRLENSIAVQKRVIERREAGRSWTMANDRNAGAAALACDRRRLVYSADHLEALKSSALDRSIRLSPLDGRGAELRRP